MKVISSKIVTAEQRFRSLNSYRDLKKTICLMNSYADKRVNIGLYATRDEAIRSLVIFSGTSKDSDSVQSDEALTTSAK